MLRKWIKISQAGFYGKNIFAEVDNWHILVQVLPVQALYIPNSWYDHQWSHSLWFLIRPTYETDQANA